MAQSREGWFVGVGYLKRKVRRPRQVVGRQLHEHPVAGEDLDVVLAHLAADVGEDFVAVGELDLEHGARQGLADDALDFEGVFLSWYSNLRGLVRGWPMDRTRTCHQCTTGRDCGGIMGIVARVSR